MIAELLATAEHPIFLIIFGVIFVIGWIVISSTQDKALNATLTRVAKRTGGTFVKGGFFRESHLELRFVGRAARLEICAGSEDSSPYTKVVVKVAGASPGILHILEDGFGQSFLKMFGAQDLEIGDPAFDRDYVIKATPSSLAKRLFNRERHLEGVRLVRRLKGFTRPTFDLDGQTVTVMVRQELRDEIDLVKLIECARDFTAFVLQSSGAPGIVLGEVRVSSGGECPVCGSAMEEGVIRCEACRTPHHRECWQYMGRCTTYACRGRRFVA